MLAPPLNKIEKKKSLEYSGFFEWATCSNYKSTSHVRNPSSPIKPRTGKTVRETGVGTEWERRRGFVFVKPTCVEGFLVCGCIFLQNHIWVSFIVSLVSHWLVVEIVQRHSMHARSRKYMGVGMGVRRGCLCGVMYGAVDREKGEVPFISAINSTCCTLPRTHMLRGQILLQRQARI